MAHKSGSDAWDPSQYEKFKDERSQPFFDLVDLLLPCSGGSLIDLGCGTGELTRVAHEKLGTARTLGIDSSAEMLKKSTAFAGPSLSFLQQDLQSWVAPSAYDVVLSNAALQWCLDHPALLKNMRVALRAQGQLAVQMPMNFDYPTHTLANAMSHEKHWRQKLNGQTYDKQDSMLSPEEYSKLLFDLGFQEQKVFLRVYAHVLESQDGVLEWVKGTLLRFFKSHLSASDYEEFLAEYKTRLFQQLPDQKPFFYPFKRIFLWAKL
jgi:trans-aconitate 2-methyltransferase